MEEFHTTVDNFVMSRSQSSRVLLINKIDSFPPEKITTYPNHDGVLFTLVDRLSFKLTDDESILLSAYNKAPNSVFTGKDKHKRTMLHRVIQAGCSPGIVQLTLERSPESYQSDHDKGGNTPFHYAAKRADINVINRMIATMTEHHILHSTRKRNKGGRTPLFEVIDSSKHNTLPIHNILQVTDTKTIWETKDKTGRLPIERIVNGTVELYCSFINRLTIPSVQFYNNNVSILQRIIRDQNIISISNVINLSAALIINRPVFLYQILTNSHSVDGLCDDIFTQIIQKSQYPSLAFKLLGFIGMSEIGRVMTMKRDIWEQTLFHIAAINFTDLISCIRLIAPTGMSAKECLTLQSLKGTPMHIVIQYGSTYDFETRVDLLSQECTEQFIQPMHTIRDSLLVKDCHGKYPFEYAKSAKIIEVLFPYLISSINNISTEVIKTAVKVHSFYVFMETMKFTDEDPVKNDSLLKTASLKQEIIETIRPRKVLEYMIHAIHPLKVTHSTMHHLISIAANIASSTRDADIQLVRSIYTLKKRWTIWMKWKRVQGKVRQLWIYYYWENMSLRKYYTPHIGTEYIKSVHQLGYLLTSSTHDSV